MSRPGGTRTPKLRIHTECSNHLRYRDQTFAVPCFKTGSGGIGLFVVKLTFEMLTVRGQKDSLSTNEWMFCESVEVFETENISTCYLNRIDFGGYIPVHLVVSGKRFWAFWLSSIQCIYFVQILIFICAQNQLLMTTLWTLPVENHKTYHYNIVFSNELDFMLILSWYLLFFSSFMFVCFIGLPCPYTNCILRNLLPTIIPVKLITACKQCF